MIANAGVMACPFAKTADGFETQFANNHLGHFALVSRIAALMKPGSRLVNLSSAGHRYSDVDLDDPNFDRTPYDPWIAYGRSKTANVLFAVEFDRRHKASGVAATAVHPGGIQTELSRHLTPEMTQAGVTNSPWNWAMAQTNLGNALLQLGSRQNDLGLLEKVVAAHRATLKVYTRQRYPHDWAVAQMNLGGALGTIGQRESGTTRLKEAAEAYRLALLQFTPEDAPFFRNHTQHGLDQLIALIAARDGLNYAKPAR